MLVLTRREGDTIVINGNITIKVFDIGQKQVRFGIEAPIEVPVRRGEQTETMNDTKDDRNV